MISTLGGLLNLNHLDQSSRANDVIVIRHRDGSLHSTPFNVRFGRRQMWSTAGRVVQVEVNGELTSAVMKIGKGGETYWLQPTYGAFGHHAHPHRDSVRASTNATEERGRTTAATAAAAAAAAAAVAAAKVHANRDMPRQHSSRSNDDHHNGGLPGGEANPPLVVNAADLRHFSIHPESPPELSASETSPRQGDQNAVTDPQSGQLPRLSAVPPSALSTTAVMHTMKATSHGPSPVGPAPADASELIASPNSLDSTSSLPLLHRGDNGDLVVETRAIHSAEDVQEARLALQVMAAAEKSRRRLSKLLLKEDSFFLQSAEEEEGQLDATTGGAAAAATADVQEATHRKDEGQVGTERNPQTWNAESSSEDKEKKAAVAAAAAVPAEAGPTATAATSAGIDGEVAVPVPPTASAASPSPHHKSPSAAAAPVDDAEVSSVGSASGSTDSYKVEDTDDYFLETIDADEYAAMYGEEELLKNVSFSSSVTSGVSITDAVMSGSGSDVSKTSPAGRTTGDAAVVAATAAAISTPAAHAISTSAQHDSPLNPGKAGGGGGVSALSAAPTAPATRAKADTAVDDVTEVLDAEGRVVHHPSSAVVAAAAVAAADAAEGGGGGGSYFTRTLIPVEADLWKLHLRDGCNKVRYLARKDKGEVVSIACNIFLWNWTDRLVVSDVDGTITKSDLWGHFYAMLGKGGDWTHPGICTLYSKIARNGYRMVYLTARSVSQINQTKAYLFTLQQDGVGLPLGPVLTAPQRFFTALTQEVSKQSHVFKIACLTSVRAAFPPHTKPFFAGFGNRYNDVISYDAVGIPTHKIFIIDPSSVLHVCLVRQTYRDLGHLVDVTFPPLRRNPVVLRAPPLPRRPQQLSEPASKHKDDGHAPAEGEAGKDARRGMERHAYARDLLHRSSSASSSSSSSSSSCSEAPSGDYSSDPQEHGSASLECSMGSASATLASGGPPPPHEQQHHHHHHSHGSGEAYNAVRPASVAFSLVDSFVVAAHGESSGSSSDGGAAARTSAAVAPSNTRTAATHAGERGPATPSSLSSATYGALSSATKAAAVPAGGAAPPLSASRAKPTASWEVGSTEYSCFSGPASTSMGKTTAAAAPAGQGTEVAGGPSSSGLLAGTALPNAPSFTAASATTAAPSHAASLAAGRGGGPSGGADNTSRHQSNGPTYNYGQRGRFDGSGGNSGGGGGDCVEDYEVGGGTGRSGLLVVRLLAHGPKGLDRTIGEGGGEGGTAQCARSCRR
ncbi:putative Lipin [Leptomonas pyrrhocoris]|uniref:Putative Lipin n=1 Tax=Leptomonas pyrrhocoris TaxID=157538 RepID=A0A0M9G6W4_LEPPY|nr:putative Lipin [Leptomonas pyrrhocoris]KPA83693.1 putative Lipin [Leptomonas pyrrhocoris]|eukprot:XP_015662132.1 putative Lipin [Leptomonas pyrrhocoris]